MEKAMCRVCLAENICMRQIVNKDLKHVYERLSNFKLLNDPRPFLACYICYARLQNSHQLMMKCQQSANLLMMMLNGNEHFYNIQKKQISNANALSVTEVLYNNISLNDVYQFTISSHYASGQVKNEEPPEEYEMHIKVEIEEHEVKSPSGSSPSKHFQHIDNDLAKSDSKDMLLPWSKTEPLAVNMSGLCDDQKVEVTLTQRVAVKNDNILDEKNKGIDEPKPSNMFNTEIPVIADKPPYKCHLCQKDFKAKKSLYIHLRANTCLKRFKCETCQESFLKSYHLEKHILEHTGDKRYKCDLCQNSYNQKCQLINHIRKHTGERPYECHTCQKSFRLRSALYSHIRNHTDERRFQCDTCKKVYSTSNSLKKHIRKHTGDKPFKCDVCEKSFNVKYSLQIHVATHATVKPYKCETCGTRFAFASNLRRHIRVHTGEKPYKCQVCYATLARIENLRKHMRLKHNGVIE